MNWKEIPVGTGDNTENPGRPYITESCGWSGPRFTWIGLNEPKGCLDASQLRIYWEKNGRLKQLNGQDPKNYNQSFNIKTNFNQVIMGAFALKNSPIQSQVDSSELKTVDISSLGPT